MAIEEVVTCPLGSVCEEIKDGKIHRCAWHVKMAGVAQDGTDYEEWKCAMAWQPILMVEMSSTNRGAAASIDSLRNETVKRQDMALSIAAAGMKDVQTISDQ